MLTYPINCGNTKIGKISYLGTDRQIIVLFIQFDLYRSSFEAQLKSLYDHRGLVTILDDGDCINALIQAEIDVKEADIDTYVFEQSRKLAFLFHRAGITPLVF